MEEIRQNLGMMKYKYNMHTQSNLDESKEDFKGGGWKCERVIEGSESSG
jgi:hypothetical protein